MKKELGFEISKNNGENLEELITLTKTYYSDSDIIKKNYLDWQYNNNPAGKPFLFTSREEITKELSGQYLVIPIKFNVLKEEHLGTLSLNTLTSPKYQGRGLFTKMAKATYDDCEKQNAVITIGFPNPNSYPGFVKKLDFEHLGDIPLMVKPLKYFNLIKSYLKKKKIKHGKKILLSTIKNKNIKEFDFKKDKEQYELFWNIIKSQYDVSTNKDFKFLKWRYKDIPTREYKLYKYVENNKIKGIVIINSRQVWGFNVGVIMDILITNDNINVGEKLLKYIKTISKNSNLDFITCLHSKSNEFKLLKSQGYYVLPQKILPQKIHFIVRINKKFKNFEIPLHLKNWKLTFGDYDIF